MAAVTTPPEPNRRKTLVTVAALVGGGLAIVLISVLCRDSFTGKAPSAGTIFIRLTVLTITVGMYVAVSIFYGKRNAAFREKLKAAAEATPAEPEKKRKKKR